MKFAAFGRTHWLYDSIIALMAAGHELVLLGTSPASPEYRVGVAEFEQLAQAVGCPYFVDSAINDEAYIQLAQASQAQVAVSVNWLTLIRQPMRAVFPMGILNAHAGDLPRYRGNAAPNWAILNDEADIALTVHVMTDGLDAGAVLLKRRLTLTQDTYIGDVYHFIETNLPDMFIEALNGMAAGTLTAIPQSTDVALSLRCFPRVGSDSLLDWQRPATELARLVRASAEPFAGAYSFRGLEKITVWRARASRLPYPYVGTPGQVAERFLSSQEVAVLTGEGVLLLQELQTPNTGRAPATEIIRSLRDRLGIDLTQLMQLLSSGNPPLPPLS